MRLPFSIVLITAISFSLGFFRDILIANTFGASWQADALFVALIVPVFFENIFGLSFRDALIPHLLQQRLRLKIEDFISTVRNLYFSASVLGLFFFLFFAAGATTWLKLVAPGWTEAQVNEGLPVFLLGLSLIVIQTILYFQSALLNIEMRFILPLWRPVLFNLGAIVMLLLLPGKLVAVFCGIIIGQLFLLILQHQQTRHLYTMERVEKLRPSYRFMANFAPVLLATIAMQGCVIAERIFASTLHTGTITLLSYAYRIVTIPLTLFSLSVLAVLYPVISRSLAEDNHGISSGLARKGAEIALVFLVPPAVMFACIPSSTVATILERGAFGPLETAATASLMTGYAIGLPGMGLALLWGRILLAQKREKEFLIATMLTFCLTVASDFILLHSLGAAGLAIAFTLGSWLQAIITGGMVYNTLPRAIPALSMFRWLLSALSVAFLLTFWPKPVSSTQLTLSAVAVCLAHALLMAILGERALFTRSYWKLRTS